MGNVCIFVYLYIPKTEIYGYLIGYTRRYLFVGGIGGVFFADLAGAAGSVFGFVAVAFYGYAEFTVTELVVWGLLVVLAQAMDYVTPMLGTKYSGGSKWGNWGCAVGTVAGIFVFPPWGILLGPFVGAFVGELLGGKASGDALKASFGGVRGFFIECRAEGYPLRLFYL